MLRLPRILVPVDFSDRSTAAAEHAAVIARRFGSKLVFLHAVPPGPYDHAIFSSGFAVNEVYPPREDVQAALRDEMQKITDKIGGGVEVETLVSFGDPAAEIEKVARQAEMGLIVMPTHGFGAFRRYLLGSVVSKVLHDLTSTPVLTGAHVEEISPFAVRPFERIGCAVDLSEHSADVLAWAADFAAAWTAELHLIHASDSPDALDELRGLAARGDREIANFHTGELPIVNLVHDVVEAENLDLLVIGRSPHRTGLGRLRSDAYALIRDSPIPVVSV